ncbi:hypothetical protein D9M71_129980 [compost metagenome]
MELGDAGVAGLEHLDIELPGDDFHLLRIEPAHQAVHQLAPGPEAVVGVARHLGKAGHGALEGMGVQVGHARQHRPLEAFGAFSAGIGQHLFDQAVGTNLEADIARPALRQQGAFGEESRHDEAPVVGCFICIYIYRRLRVT